MIRILMVALMMVVGAGFIAPTQANTMRDFATMQSIPVQESDKFVTVEIGGARNFDPEGDELENVFHAGAGFGVGPVSAGAAILYHDGYEIAGVNPDDNKFTLAVGITVPLGDKVQWKIMAAGPEFGMPNTVGFKLRFSW